MARRSMILGSCATTRSPGFYLPLRTSLVGSDGRVATFSRPSKAWYEDASGVIREVAEGVPRLRPDRGCLIEEARTNRLLWSADLSQDVWSKSGATVERVPDPNALGGFVNRITFNAADGIVWQFRSGLPLAARIGSVRMRRVSGDGAIRIGSGEGVPPPANGLDGTLRRFTVSRAEADQFSLSVRGAVAGDVVDVEIAQVEEGAFATSPILTAGTPLARAADVLSVSTAGWPVVAGRVAIRFAPVWSGTPPASASLLDARSGIPGDGIAWYLAVDGSQRFNFRRAADSATADSASIAQTYIAATRVSAGWTSAGALFTRDSAPVANIGSPTGLALAALGATARVGCVFNGSGFANAWLSDLEVSGV